MSWHVYNSSLTLVAVAVERSTGNTGFTIVVNAETHDQAPLNEKKWYAMCRFNLREGNIVIAG